MVYTKKESNISEINFLYAALRRKSEIPKGISLKSQFSVIIITKIKEKH